MKRCLQCGGEVYRTERAKFCSSSCCQLYNKKLRKQQPRKQVDPNRPKRTYHKVCTV